MENTSSFQMCDVRLKAHVDVLPHHRFTNMSIYLMLIKVILNPILKIATRNQDPSPQFTLLLLCWWNRVSDTL